MAANVLTHRPPLGFFRRFVQEDDGSHSEGLNLKHRGIVPITTWSECGPWKPGYAKPTLSPDRTGGEGGAMNENDASSLRDA